MKFLHFPVLDSTNNKAKELLQHGESESFVVVADVQTNGRGQQGKVWKSPKGGLYFTLAIKWEDHFQITLTKTPLAFGELVSDWCQGSFGFCPQVKWPNDIYFAGKKLSGILCEKFQDNLLIGIGVNLNQEPFTESLSVSKILGQSLDVHTMQKSFFDFLKQHSRSVLESSFEPNWNLYQKAWVSEKNQTHIAQSILASGALELSAKNSKLINLVSADHSFKLFSQQGSSYVVLDIGNSRVKAALFSHEDQRVKEYAFGSPVEISKVLLDWKSRFDSSLVVSLSVNHESLALLQKQLPDSFSWLSLSKYLPYLKSKYKISEIGLDRIAAMEAAGFLFGRNKPLVVVSAGTALTVDLISHDFEHIGGYICAGLSLKLRALADCSLLPQANLPSKPANNPPAKTMDALAYGAVHESVAFIQNMLRSLGGNADLVLTGGDGLVLKPYFPDAVFDEKLIVIGGNLMFQGGYISEGA